VIQAEPGKANSCPSTNGQEFPVEALPCRPLDNGCACTMHFRTALVGDNESTGAQSWEGVFYTLLTVKMRRSVTL
jgi:hypothetical protein